MSDPYATHPRIPLISVISTDDSEQLAPTEILPGNEFRLHCAARTDVGRKRRNNEDDYLVDQEQSLFAVFDGMGGMAAGEVASAEAKQGYIDTLQAIVSGGPPAPELLQQCLKNANERILANAEQNLQRSGMGSTVVSVLVRGQAMHILSLGDSRLYEIHPEGQALPLTRDHSVVAILVENGEMTAEEARVSNMKNQLLGSLGESELVPPFVDSVAVFAGQRFVLCSDGLWDMLTDTEIGQIARKATTPEEAAYHLIDAANAAGGQDNITVIVLDIEGNENEKS